MNNKNKHIFSLFVIIFALSGFSGLIYQSIWTHYLKLFLGHASYAQVLVLAIFMGGMAIGAALASRLGKRISNMILFYGIAEILIGVLALLFHQVFLLVQSSSYDLIFPALADPVAVNSYKWFVAAILILPQSILLGSTFPFLSAGLIRRFGQNQTNPKNGRILATLYFVNSLGASIGVLANVFIIIPFVGLPGSLLTAGIINILLAMVVYFLSKGDVFHQRPAQQQNPTQQTKHPQSDSKLLVIMLMLASLTGLASFMYEIGWIRMLTMVLGGSTHSFEIMLSAFILGLALGSWWIRPRIDRFRNPLAVLGLIQIVMGVLAALTIPLYAYTYQLMAFAINALQPSHEGYLLYAFFSYSISLLIMLPAAFCAGTTLPLATHILLKKGFDDSAIGKVYAWNTLGSIAGVVIAIQVVMPLLGLKWVILGGALVDLALGLAVLKLSSLLDSKIKNTLTYAGSALLALFFITNNHLDTRLMASGVYRYGLKQQVGEIIFHKDGKTSTVAVRKKISGQASLLNNGKPDASLYIDRKSEKNEAEAPDAKTVSYTGDEPTMVLLGVLPYVYSPNARYIANIGLGSGLTVHTLLQAATVEQVDTIEIEEQVVEAAKLFGKRVDNAFIDPRSKIHIEDAKTYFSSRQTKYDVIVSEPPNPWVAGVAGLFSQQFYQHVKRYMTDEGVLVQWVQTYEITPELIATVYRALAKEFRDIHVYQVSEGDLALVASRNKLTPDFSAPFQHPALKSDLDFIKIKTPDDLEIRKLAERKELGLILGPLATNANSDFFPILDQGAAEARFRRQNAQGLYALHNASVLKKLLYGSPDTFRQVTAENSFKITQQVAEAHVFYDSFKRYLPTNKKIPLTGNSQGESYAIDLVQMLRHCQQGSQMGDKAKIDTKLALITGWASETLPPSALAILYSHLQQCNRHLSEKSQYWLDSMQHWNNEAYEQAIDSTKSYLDSIDSIKDGFDLHLLKINLGSHIAKKEFSGEEFANMLKLTMKLSTAYPGDLEFEALKRWLNLP